MRSLAVVVALLGPAAALADGRPPLTNGVYFRPGDSHSLYVATTFGLLISHDDGCAFRWVCEDDIGYGGSYDPKYRIARDGAIFATTVRGLRVSRDGGCSFTTATADQPAGAPGRIADRWVDAIDIGPTGEIWVTTADAGRSNDVYRSTDNGQTFTPRGLVSPAIWWKSIAIARALPGRIYVTGYQVAGRRAGGGQLLPTGHVVRSDDSGAHWVESPLAGVRFGPAARVYVWAIDRRDPDVVLMSSALANPPGGDRLYRSRDGGTTWREVLATTGKIVDVSLMSSGAVVVASQGAAFRSADRGATFAPIANAPELACVGERDDGRVFGCGANWEPDRAAIATSVDGASWDKRFRFVDLAGPVDCPAGTAARDACGGQWPALQQQLGATRPAAVCPALPALPPLPPSPPSDVAPAARASGGCCDAGAASPRGLVGLAALVAGCFGMLLRRRHRSPCGGAGRAGPAAIERAQPARAAASSASRPSRQLG